MKDLPNVTTIHKLLLWHKTHSRPYIYSSTHSLQTLQQQMHNNLHAHHTHESHPLTQLSHSHLHTEQSPLFQPTCKVQMHCCSPSAAAAIEQSSSAQGIAENSQCLLFTHFQVMMQWPSKSGYIF